MRRYAPAPVESVLAGLLEEPSLASGVLHHEVIAGPPGPDRADPGLARPADPAGSRRAGHRDASTPTRRRRSRRSGPVATSSSSRPTASGKTLCYTLPVLQALAEDPSARALFLFPTKALGQDQVAEFAELARGAELGISAATYDGDTPAPIRSAIRTAGQVVVTNPDMLHAAILPHHTKWFQLFEQLRIIVIDELHTYRGIFGSHVANVLRRLLRLCAHYGSHPIVVCCSATIGNPAELAATLTGRDARLVDRNGAPSGERHVLLVEPPLLDRATGARGSALSAADRWALPFLRAGRQTIVFGRSRTAVEILLTGLREALREGAGPRSRIRGYRGGYLPTERRSIERGLRDGEVLGVVSTNALELGVDIGRLDVADPGRLPGLGRRHLAADRPSRSTPGRQRRDPRRVGRTGRPLRGQPSGVPPRRLARGGPTRPGQPPRPARPPQGGHVRAAVRAGRGLRAGSGRRPPRLPRRGGSRPPGRRRAVVLVERELPGLGDLAPDRRPGERRDRRHDPRSAAGHRRGGPVLGPGPRPRAGHLPPRVGPVPRGPARLARAEGVRPPGRRGLLHVRQSGRDPQAARRLRRGAPDGRSTGPRRGDGRQPRHPVQEAQVRDRRERRLGADRPARARAPDDGRLVRRRPGDRRPGIRRELAPGRARCRAHRGRPGDPGGRQRPADGRPARPRPGQSGPLAPPRGADDLSLRGRPGRGRALRAALRADGRAHRRRRRPHRPVPLRRRLPRLHRSATRTRGGRQGARPAAPRRARRVRRSPEDRTPHAARGRRRRGRAEARRDERDPARATARRPAPRARSDAAAPAILHRTGRRRASGPCARRPRRGARRACVERSEDLARRLAAAVDGEWIRGTRRRLRPGRDGAGPPAGRSRAARRGCRAARRPGSRSSASTSRPPVWRPGRERSPSSSGSGRGPGTGSARSSSCSPTTPRSRPCSTPSRRRSRPRPGW